MTKFRRDHRWRWRQQVAIKRLRYPGHLFVRVISMIRWAVGRRRRLGMPPPPPCCCPCSRLYKAYKTGNRLADQREVSHLRWLREFRDLMDDVWTEKQQKRMRHLKSKVHHHKLMDRWKAARKEKRLAASLTRSSTSSS